MEQVAEVVGVPAMARVPGVKPWVLGLANLRGRLIPVMDLYRFLHGVDRRGPDAASRRVIVMDAEGIVAGLVVDGVEGMRHFWADEQVGPPPGLDEPLVPYVRAAFPMGDRLVGVFDFTRLAGSEAFRNVAL
jgi:twitching motility protein PilI